MGASHSNDRFDAWRDQRDTITTSGQRSVIHPSDGHHRRKFKAKPNPPVQVTIATVTHNSVSLSWLPPRNDHGHPVIAYTIEACRPKHGKRWQVLTKNCQSTNYEARYLESDTQYAFKVRAENVFGTGKPSSPSDRVTTKVFEMSSDLNCYLPASPSSASIYQQQQTAGGLTGKSSSSLSSNPNDSSDGRVGSRTSYGGRSASTTSDQPHGCQVYPAYQSLKRRHSFNVQLNGGVTSILNHSDVFLNSSFSSSTSTITNGTHRHGNGHGGLEADSKTLSLSRGQGYRSSLQAGRKASLSAFLPGAKAQSMNRLRESRNSLRSGSSDLNGNTLTKTALLTRDSLAGNAKHRDVRNSVASSTSDGIGSLSSNSKEENRRSRGSRCSLLSSQSDATVSNSHDGSRHSDYSSSMDNLDAVDFGDSHIANNSVHISLCPSLEDIVDEFSNTPTDKNLSYQTCEDEDDEISKIKQELRNIELTDEKLRSQSQDMRTDLQFVGPIRPQSGRNYYDTFEDPWEKFPPKNGIPESIMVAPFCDDIKIALYAKNIMDDVTNGFFASDKSEEGSNDFRTLRSVLQSDQTIVRPTRPMPEVIGVVVGEAGEARTLTRGKLTTIEDADEEEDPVRVTTL